jgi:hypothetical protein
MPLLTIVVVIIIAGVALWLVNNYIPMQRTLKKILNIVIVVIVVLWLLNIFGVLDSIQHVRI